MHFRNQVDRAVKLCGGPTMVGVGLGVANATVHDWIRRGYVPKLSRAKELAEFAEIDFRLLRKPITQSEG